MRLLIIVLCLNIQHCRSYFMLLCCCCMNLNLKMRYYLQGYGILTVQARSHHLRPIPCKDLAVTQMSECKAPTGGQAAMLYSGLYLIALGTGGIKAALPALGADQFDQKDPKEATQLSSFFNWFLFSLTIGSIIGVTFIVWIGANQGWDWSFIVCTIAILFSILFICMGNSLYRNNVPKGSPLLRIIQVLPISLFTQKQIFDACGSHIYYFFVLLGVCGSFQKQKASDSRQYRRTA